MLELAASHYLVGSGTVHSVGQLYLGSSQLSKGCTFDTAPVEKINRCSFKVRTFYMDDFGNWNVKSILTS